MPDKFEQRPALRRANCVQCLTRQPGHPGSACFRHYEDIMTDSPVSETFQRTWTPRVLSLLRIVAAFMFMTHGMHKILGFPGPQPALPNLLSLTGVAGLLELFGGMFLLVGLFTRPVAFLLSGEMAFAYFMAHASHGFWPFLNHGELAALYAFVFLYLAAAGGGVLSIDWLWRDRTNVSGGHSLGPGARR